MRPKRLLILFPSLLFLLVFEPVALRSQTADTVSTPASTDAAVSPPMPAVKPTEDDYFGTKISDPYRYMEDLQNKGVQDWFSAQNEYARATLARIPGRHKLLARLRELEKSAPARISQVRRLPGDVYFYLKVVSGEEFEKLYRRRGLHGEEKLVADPA